MPQVQTVGDVTNVFFSVMMGSMALSQAGPNIKALTDAIGAMRNIVKIIKREPKIGTHALAVNIKAGRQRAVRSRDV